MYKVLNGSGNTDELTRLRQGREIEFGFDQDGEFAGLVIHNSRTTKLKALRDDDGFHTIEEMREPEIELAFAGGEIQTSFALAANRAGLSGNVRNKLSRIFGWEIDFSRDLRKGDQFGVLYEKQYLDGEMIGYGRILAASFINKGEEYSAALYTDSEGHSDYYAPDGSSLRKAFLRSPVNYGRISSHFDMNRKHPILNRVRPHEGTDFAASSGTPVRASGDGRIIHIGRDGGYGKTIRIDHGNEVTTVYSHLRGYKRGMRSGKRVQQGDVIGYVGMSGLATGPHLHYEYRLSGRPRNPLHVDLPDADPIPAGEMQAFRMQASPLLAQLSDHDESFQVAMTED
jgi:Membrane proteins related to metalloendopeptidases